MEQKFEKYKGIHPGAILERELKKKNIAQRPFALSLPEHPQTFNTIIKGKRDLNTALALKIDRALALEEGTMMILQIFYDIQKEKLKEATGQRPDFSALRPTLFWDTNIASIDWQKMYKAVIKRVFERGNSDEKREIIRFYGPARVKAVIGADLT